MSKYDGPTLFGLKPFDQQSQRKINSLPTFSGEITKHVIDLMRLNGMSQYNESELALTLLDPDPGVVAMMQFGYECPSEHLRKAKTAFIGIFGENISEWDKKAPLLAPFAKGLCEDDDDDDEDDSDSDGNKNKETAEKECVA